MRFPPLATVALVLAACQPAPETPPPADAPAPASKAPAPAPHATSPSPALTTFLQNRTRDAMAPLTYVSAETGEDAESLTLVYLVGPEFCGSGGCKLLILRRSGEAYSVLGDTTITRAPIRILRARTNGLPDIGVYVAGGGIMEGYEARLRFDGTRYPSNPSVPPAERINDAEGIAVITDESPRTTLKP